MPVQNAWRSRIFEFWTSLTSNLDSAEPRANLVVRSPCHGLVQKFSKVVRFQKNSSRIQVGDARPKCATISDFRILDQKLVISRFCWTRISWSNQNSEPKSPQIPIRTFIIFLKPYELVSINAFAPRSRAGGIRKLKFSTLIRTWKVNFWFRFIGQR